MRIDRRFVTHNFNPLPSYEGRREIIKVMPDYSDFNPLPSYEGRPVSLVRDGQIVAFQSTPLIRGETFSSIKSPP